MSALGEISKRLKTDIGETARAAIDPNFSQQLTQDRFRQAELSKRREQQLEDQAKDRAQQQEDLNRQFKLKTHMFTMSTAIEEGLKRGDWTAVARLSESPNLDEQVRDMGKLMVNTNLPQGFDYALQAGKQQLELDKLKASEVANRINNKRLDAGIKQKAEEILLKKRKIELEEAINKRQLAEEEGDVDVIKDYFSNTEALSQEEIDRWSPMVAGDISAKQAVNVMDAYLREKQASNAAEAKRLNRTRTDKDIQTFKYFDGSLKKQTGPMREAVGTIGELKQLLSQEVTGVTNKAITAKISQLFDTNVRALANLQEWKNLGDIGQKIGGKVRDIIAGGRLESQYDDILQAITPYEKELVKAQNLAKADVWDQSVGFGVEPVDLFPKDWGERFQIKTDPEGKKVRLDMWRKTVEYLE